LGARLDPAPEPTEETCHRWKRIAFPSTQAGRASKEPVISVVIPAHNAATTLAAQLDALASQTYRGEWEVVVADNGSTDETRAVASAVAGRLPDLRVVDASSLRGTNHARNVGVQAARGEFVLFCDADDVVAHTWLDAMAVAVRSCDAVGGAIDSEFLNRPGNASARPSHDLWRRDFLPAATGANCGVRATVLHELGGFDERYRFGGDDIEFFWRLQLAGHRVCFVRDAVVHIRERSEARELARRFFRHGRADAQLYHDFRPRGMPRSPIRLAVKAWAQLVLLLPWYWANRGRRRHWVSACARRVGRVAGSVHFRTLYL
jgi:glycosyltransferase involved in cell wall biosynthesis